jgi:hypothetical protein
VAARAHDVAPFACHGHRTIFVYLNDVATGGRTRWRWTEHDRTFYDAPRPSDGRVDLLHGAGDEVAVTPRRGLGVLHFPSTTAAVGGVTDYNAFHEAEPPTEPEEKWVAQQFIWSHPRLDWTRVLDDENWEPRRRRSADTI